MVAVLRELAETRVVIVVIYTMALICKVTLWPGIVDLITTGVAATATAQTMCALSAFLI
jgi:hypothetical protein